MAKRFNITGLCLPNEHYMADVSGKMKQVMEFVDNGEYFIINRPRQYGKTTTLATIANTLNEKVDYVTFKLSFEGVGDSFFSNEKELAQGFLFIMASYARYRIKDLTDWLKEKEKQVETLKDLSEVISELVYKTEKKVVVLIDEVDKSSNNQLFISFLAMLRDKYLMRQDAPTFHSVVLAGVHDVKSLKLQIRPNEEAKLNSPWNIAAEFKVDMNLYPHEIKPMLEEYAANKNVSMDTEGVAERLFYYTSGYPFLVSKLCKMIDEDRLPKKTEKTWNYGDIEWAVKRLVQETNTNFESLIKNLENNTELYSLVFRVAIDSESIPFNIHNPAINLGLLHGMFKYSNGNGLQIHNRIYSEVIYDYMTVKLIVSQLPQTREFRTDYKFDDGTLNMEAVLLGFQAFMKKEYSRQDRDFLERHGRLVFLAFLKPILNGGGFDFKEPQVSEERRLDVAITYLKDKFVAELKLWRGEKAHQKGLLQLNTYLEGQGLNEGYLLIFDHSEVKNWDSYWKTVEGKRVFIVWV
jgi:hypothetical protein